MRISAVTKSGCLNGSLSVVYWIIVHGASADSDLDRVEADVEAIGKILDIAGASADPGVWCIVGGGGGAFHLVNRTLIMRRLVLGLKSRDSWCLSIHGVHMIETNHSRVQGVEQQRKNFEPIIPGDPRDF